MTNKKSRKEKEGINAKTTKTDNNFQLNVVYFPFFIRNQPFLPTFFCEQIETITWIKWRKQMILEQQVADWIVDPINQKQRIPDDCAEFTTTLFVQAMVLNEVSCHVLNHKAN